jgi:hypothetical protein
MVKYKGIYKKDSDHEEVICILEDRDQVVEKLLKRVDGNYCLDSYEDRLNALSVRDFCMLGCGPSAVTIETVEV